MSFFKKIFTKSRNIEPSEYFEKPLDNSFVQSVTPVKKIDKPLSDEEISKMINDIAMARFSSGFNNYNFNERDVLFEDAAKLIVQSQSGSTSLLQRRMKLGYNRTGHLMDQLEAAGIVGPNQGSKVRDVLIKTNEELEIILEGNVKTTSQIFYENHKEEIERKIIELQVESENEKVKIEKEKIRLNLLEKERKRNLQKQALQELKNEGLINSPIRENREPIPQDVMDSVWNRDGGKCVKCGSLQNLEFDHIIPFSKGGANTYRNLQLLCKKCNIEKSNKIG